MKECVDIEEMKGLTLVNIKVDREHDDVIYFTTSEGTMFQMYHEQDCCEHVWIEDICGDMDDLLNVPLLNCYESGSDEVVGEECDDAYYESSTWTFYHLATIKGSVTLRWCGQSNGYYSESVSLYKVS